MTRAELLEDLRAAGITKVEAHYDGEGDEGALDEIRCHAPSPPMYPREDLREFFYDLLGEKYGGWQDGEGSLGSFVWDIGTDKITWEHKVRVTDYEVTKEEI